MGQQRELRRAAAEAFVESLEQLQQTLESVEETVAPAHTATNLHSETPAKSALLDLSSLEDAIADIEQFIEQKQQE